MLICVIWKDNLVVFTTRELNFDELESRGLQEKQAIVIWKPSHCLIEDRRKLITPVS
jgi:hypothetical protein